MSEIETGFGSIFPAGLFDVAPGTPMPPALPPSVTGNDRAGPEPPAVLNIAPGAVANAIPQGDAGEPSTQTTAIPETDPISAINHGFGLLLLLLLVMVGLWLLFRSE